MSDKQILGYRYSNMQTGQAEHNSFVSGVPGTEGGVAQGTPIANQNAALSGIPGDGSQESDPVKA